MSSQREQNMLRALAGGYEQEFYEELANGNDVDEALARALPETRAIVRLRNAKESAQDSLHGLFRRMETELGRKPTEVEFFPVNVEALVELQGFRLRSERELVHLGIPISGRCDYSKKIIYANRDDSASRWLFTVAHELGHLAHGHPCGVAFRANPDSERLVAQAAPGSKEHRLEKWADHYATALLMPERAVKRQFQKRFGVGSLRANSPAVESILQVRHHRAGDVAPELAKYVSRANPRSLAVFFGVSARAMARRILELRLLLD